MPSMRLFGAKWTVSSDDLLIPSFVSILVRSSWLAVMIAEFLSYYDHLTCDDALIYYYYIGMDVVLGLIVFVEMAITVISTRGNIIDREGKRAAIPKLIYARVALILPELAWSGVGSYWAWIERPQCNAHVIVVCKVAVALSWTFVLSTIICLVFIFDAFNFFSHESGLWEWRLKFLFCRCLPCCRSTNEDTAGVYSDVSRVLSRYFSRDLVPSDIAAGFTLLHEKHSRTGNRGLRSRGVLSTGRNGVLGVGSDAVLGAGSEAVLGVGSDAVLCVGSEDVLGAGSEAVLGAGSEVVVGTGSSSVVASGSQPQILGVNDVSLVTDLAYYMLFAIAVYDWPEYCLRNPCCFPRLVRLSSDIPIDGTDCCSCNASKILSDTPLDPSDLVYVNFSNDIEEPVYMVAREPGRGSLVVAVRGSMSLRDGVTDAHIQPVRLSADGPTSEFYCHAGFHSAAKRIANRIAPILAAHPGCPLVVVGHSYGAGVAQLLTLLLCERHENIRCYAYGPPGTTLGLSGLPTARRFIVSVVNGNDVVPRLNYANGKVLRGELYAALDGCVRSKYAVLGSAAYRCVRSALNCFASRTASRYEDEETSDLLAESSYYSSGGYDSTDDWGDIETYPLLLAGRIVHIERGCYSNQSLETTAHWREHSSYNRILIMNNMMADHLPMSYINSLDILLRRLTMEDQKC